MIRGIFNAITDQRIRREWRWYALLRAGRWLLPSYRFQYPHMLWWQDSSFNEYLKKFGLEKGMNADRRWALKELTKLVAAVPGDTAECGVFNGSSSWLIAKALNRDHFMFDSFEGMSAPSADDSPFAYENELACSLEIAQRNLADCPKAVFLQGWIPARFNQVQDRKFCFVHIDVQQAQPTRDSIEFFYPRMNPGGLMLFDDYGFTTCPGARKTIDEFISNKPEKIIALPCGNAFLVRG
jgi:O-methyltransferase